MVGRCDQWSEVRGWETEWVDYVGNWQMQLDEGWERDKGEKKGCV